MTPLVCSKTPCTPQKQPPAKTKLCGPAAAAAGESSAGAGITTAGSAAFAPLIAKPTHDAASKARRSFITASDCFGDIAGSWASFLRQGGKGPPITNAATGQEGAPRARGGV